MNYQYKSKENNKHEFFVDIAAECKKHRITGIGYDPKLTKQRVLQTLLEMIPEIYMHVSNYNEARELNAFDKFQETCRKLKISRPQMLTFSIRISQTVAAFMSIWKNDEIKENRMGNTSKHAKEQAACKLSHTIITKFEKEK